MYACIALAAVLYCSLFEYCTVRTNLALWLQHINKAYLITSKLVGSGLILLSSLPFTFRDGYAPKLGGTVRRCQYAPYSRIDRREWPLLGRRGMNKSATHPEAADSGRGRGWSVRLPRGA